MLTENPLIIAGILNSIWNFAVLIGFCCVAALGAFVGWRIHPYTVGALTQFTHSPIQQLGARLTSTGAGAMLSCLLVVFLWPKSSSGKSAPVPEEKAPVAIQTPEVKATPFSEEESSVVIHTPEAKATPVPEEKATVAIQTPEVKATPFSEEESSVVIHTPEAKATPVPEEKAPVVMYEKIGSTTDDANLETSLKIKIADLRGQLAEVEGKINGERKRWQDGQNLINRLTNFRKTPVKEGSVQYQQCMVASRIITEVEAGSQKLKNEKAKLDATISSLEK
jgi:hypothetical protein